MTNEELISAILKDRKYKRIAEIAEEKFGKENVDYTIGREFGAIASLEEYYYRLARYASDNPTVFNIIIYFPKKTVTCNETGHTHDIEELYCKVAILYNTSFEITTARAKYTTAEVNSDYMHSHVSGISTQTSPWKSTCLGREDSPLNLIKHSPRRDDLDWINLFNEIDRFYEVESLAGVPYRRMDNITNNQYNTVMVSYYRENSKRLYKYDADFSDFVCFVKDKIKDEPRILSNINGKFILNESLYDFKLRLTNLIIEYLTIMKDNQEVNYKEIEKKFKKILEKNLKTPIGMYAVASKFSVSSYNNVYLFTFKGKEIYREVVPSEGEQFFLMPNLHFQIYVYVKLLIMINYERFRNSTETVKIIL